MLYRTHRVSLQRLDSVKVGSRQAMNLGYLTLGYITLGYMRNMTLVHFRHHLHFILFVIWLEPLPCLHLNRFGHWQMLWIAALSL